MAERTNADIKKQRLENIKRASGVNTDSGSVKRDYANHASTEDNKSSFTVYDDISVSDATNIQAEEQAESQTPNQEANPGQKHKRSSGSDFLTKNGTIKQYNTSAEMLGALTGVSVDKSPGTIGGIVNHRPDAKPMTAAQQLAAIESIVTSDSYAKALKNNAATTMQQIKRLQRKQQELTKQVEYASLTEGQLDDYSFRYDKYERRIQQLKTQYSQYEMKYMRQTGRDFKGNHSHNVVDVAMRDVKANRDYVDSLRFQIQQFENLSASSDNAEQSKELILNKKRKELESANALLKTSEERVLEMQDWQNSAEGKRKIARWEKQEARQAKRELAAKSGLRGAINKKIDSAETLVAKPFERPRKAINKAIDKVEYGLASPFRAANKVMDSAYSKAYEGLMRSKTKNAVDSAFSSVGNAAKKAAGNAKSTVANAAKAAAKAVFEMFKKAIMFLLTNPIGWAIDVLLIIVLLITGGSSGGQVATEEEIAQGDERYSSETVYRRFIQEVELDLMEFATEYRVGLSSANVSSLLYASVDPDVFEKMSEENYVEKIDELLKGEKAEYAAKTFLKQVGY
ncbi:MAG: hypothetical protein IKF58_05655, partial [Bacillus sp. (in: Bacteria)]|nr:hypothetical protein [Bacillus sp. (in: firmicutes)]